MSLARVQMDVLLMSLRQQHWVEQQRTGSGTYVYLSFDSSPQGGLDWFVTLEDRVSKDAASQVVGQVSPAQLSAWGQSGKICTATLPPVILGPGRTDLFSKFEALLHSVVLDTGGSSVTEYSNNVVCICADYGTEAHMGKVPAASVEPVQRANVAHSGGLLRTGFHNPVMQRRGRQCEPAPDFAQFLALAPESEDQVLAEQGHGQLVPVQAPSQSFFMNNALLVPGAKHILDNISKELLNKLHWYPNFAVSSLEILVMFLFLCCPLC